MQERLNAARIGGQGIPHVHHHYGSHHQYPYHVQQMPYHQYGDSEHPSQSYQRYESGYGNYDRNQVRYCLLLNKMGRLKNIFIRFKDFTPSIFFSFYPVILHRSNIDFKLLNLTNLPERNLNSEPFSHEPTILLTSSGQRTLPNHCLFFLFFSILSIYGSFFKIEDYSKLR